MKDSLAMNHQPLFWSLIGTLCNGSYVFLLFLMVNSILGPEKLADFAWSFQCYALLSFFSVFGYSILGMTEPNWNEQNKTSLYRQSVYAISRRTLLILAPIIFFCSLAITVHWGGERAYLLLILSAAILPTTLLRFHLAFLSGTNRQCDFAAVSFMRLFVLMAIIVFTWLEFQLSAIKASTALVLAETFIAGYYIITTLRVVDSKPTQESATPPQREKLYGISAFLAELTARIDILITGLLLPAHHAGTYALLSQLVRLPTFTSIALTRVITPLMSRYRYKSDRSPVIEYLSRQLHLTFYLTLLVVSVVCFTTGLGLIRGLDATNTNIFIAIVAMITAFALQAIPGACGCIFICWGQVRTQIYRQVVMFFMLSTLLTILSWRFGFLGAAIAIFISYLVYVTLLPTLINRCFNQSRITFLLNKYLKRGLFFYILVAVISITMGVFLSLY